MYSPKKKLEIPPSAYNFPFEPYEIQKNLMDAVYQVIENKQIGIFESPTGTGKSLTLTCAALRWLLDHQALVKEDLQENIYKLKKNVKFREENASSATDWITSQYETNQKRSELEELVKKYSLIEEYESKIEELKVKRLQEKKKISNVGYNDVERANEDDLLLNEDDTSADEDTLTKQEYKDVKIFFCSRTHSQLTQVVREVKRTTYGAHIRCVSLASRQNLCIHSEIRKLPSSSLINERCLDMAKSKSKVTLSDAEGCTQKKLRTKNASSCPHKTQALVENLSKNSLVNMLDIEDLVRVGQEMSACPYYASRTAANDAQLIMLPYQILLHRKTREQSGISLQNSVIIIDEAHNLLDAINSIYSTEMKLSELKTILEILCAYKMKYVERFNTHNLLKINQIIFIIKRIIKILTNQDHSGFRILKTYEFMSEGEFFNINLYEILQFCENSRIAQKLLGFAKHSYQQILSNENKKPAISAISGALDFLKKIQSENKKSTNKNPKDTSPDTEEQKNNIDQQIQCPIRLLISFFECLTECEQDGRVLLNYVESDVKKTTIKFILLNPGGHFDNIVQEARTIIIAGGTLQPTDEITNQLFKKCPNRVVQKFYDHVVPPDAVLPFVVCKGPTSKAYRFNFATKQDKQMISELGLALQNLCNVIPAGIICFFSSYDYLDCVFEHFKQTGLLEKIKQKKFVFRERRTNLEGQTTVDKLLTEYANAIKNQERFGAILFSVVGGKLSEGLNFCDELGRCVVIVGMPYPDKNSPELQERMAFVESMQGNGTGVEFYENLCMKAVNQCIGRSVRHIRDYAAILLFDERYANQNIIKKLPQWISRNLEIAGSFGLVQRATAKYFREKKTA